MHTPSATDSRQALSLPQNIQAWRASMSYANPMHPLRQYSRRWCPVAGWWLQHRQFDVAPKKLPQQPRCQAEDNAANWLHTGECQTLFCGPDCPPLRLCIAWSQHVSRKATATMSPNSCPHFELGLVVIKIRIFLLFPTLLKA